MKYHTVSHCYKQLHNLIQHQNPYRFTILFTVSQFYTASQLHTDSYFIQPRTIVHNIKKLYTPSQFYTDLTVTGIVSVTGSVSDRQMDRTTY